ncbi:MAG: hypothetical protein VB138_01815 [Burkholderia sp.]
MKKNPFIDKYIEENKRHLVSKETAFIKDSEFVKVYIEANAVLSSVQNCSKLLFEYMFRMLQKSEAYNQTVIDLSYRSYLIFCRYNKLKPMVKSSFYRSRSELISKNVIAETDDMGMYFFNLNFFFNGDRFYVVKEYIRASEGKSIDIPTHEVEESDLPASFKELPMQGEANDKDDWEEVMRVAKANKKKSAFSV